MDILKARPASASRRHLCRTQDVSHARSCFMCPATMQIKCDICGTMFNRRSSLVRHRHNFHNPITEIFSCKQCCKTFSRSDILRRHERLHRGEGLTPCWLCSRPTRSDYLPKHIDTCLKMAEKIFFQGLEKDMIDADSGAEDAKPKQQPFLQWTPLVTTSIEKRGQLAEQRNPPAEKRGVEQPVRIFRGDKTSAISTKIEQCEMLMHAIENDNVSLLEKALEKYKFMGLTLNHIDTLFASVWNFTVFIWACVEGSENIVRFLLRRNTDVNQKTRLGKTGLYVACLRGRLETVKTLLSAGAEIDIDCGGYIALCAAVRKGHIDIVVALLDAGADVNRLDGFSCSPLWCACTLNNLDIAELLIRRGADVNANTAKCSLLNEALRSASVPLVKRLLEAGARADLVDSDCIGMLRRREDWLEGEYLHAQEKLELLEKYLKSPPPNGTNITPVPPCEDVNLANQSEVLSSHHTEPQQPVQLIARGGDDVQINLSYRDLVEKIESALQHESISNLQTFYRLRHCVCWSVQKINQLWKRYHSYSLLTTAVGNGCNSLVDYFLQAGLDVNEQNEAGWTPLHAACANGHHGSVDLLIRHGARVETSDINEKTPLAVAMATGNSLIVQRLLRAGANPDGSKKGSNLTPLQLACQSSKTERIVQELVEAGADVNLGSVSPLNIAIRSCSWKNILALLKAGARVDSLPKWYLDRMKSEAADDDCFVQRVAEELIDRHHR